MIKIKSQDYLDVIRVLGDKTEVFKVLSGYFITGKNKTITSRLLIGDNIEYSGHVSKDVELSKLYFQVMNQEEMLNKQAAGYNITIENSNYELIHVFVDKGYVSKTTKMSRDDLKTAMESVHKCIDGIKMENGSFFDLIEKSKEILKLKDPTSSDYINHKNIIDIFNGDYLFSFILHSYSVKMNGASETKSRDWYVFDFNDNRSRALKEVTDEFRILPVHLENISEIKPR